MKRIITLLCFIASFWSLVQAQTCASPFAVGATNFTEVCNPSGAAGPYQISVSATSDSALSLVGLWEVPSSVLDADVDCNSNTFTITRQPLTPGFELIGQGSLSGVNVSISYNVYVAGDSVTVLDACSGIYSANLVGNAASLGGPSCMLYPNPSKDRTVLVIKGVTEMDGAWNYRVVDVQGRVILEGDLSQQLSAEIQVNALTEGVYRVVAQDGAGQMVSKALVVR